MRLHTHGDGEHRASALWGRGGRETRSSALWGRGGRGGALLAAMVACLVVPTAGFADGDREAVVPADLLAAAGANPNGTFNVIVQGERGRSSRDIADRVSNENGKLKRAYRSIAGVSATLTGEQVLELADDSHVAAITPDTRMSLAGSYESAEMWRASTRVSRLYGGPQAPAIAIVDSGVDSTKLADFGSRVVARVNFSSATPNSVGDQLGHGTMVAGLAAGADNKYPGAAPTSPIVDVRVTDGRGHALTSDIVAAIDWIIANKDAHNIRVANFSLSGTSETSIVFDPLNKAVEKLWLSGVTVVAAAGNNGGAGEVPIASPANDPFVITVGALDIGGSVDQSDDVRAPWSAYGHTADGFAKPELSAPGRYMVAPVPATSLLATTKPDRLMGFGYLWMSGTSFAAPVVAGTAAQILARHPDFSPDQVKGALMVSANHLSSQGISTGVGALDAAAAAAVSDAPNPNVGLQAFVSNGEFDAGAWVAHVTTNSNWTLSNWTNSNWVNSNWVNSHWVNSNWVNSNWTLSNWVNSNWVNSNWTLSNWTQSNWVD